jgi:DUF971 family protein
MTSGTNPRYVPVEITRDAGEQRMYIRWADGHESYIPWETLRWKCPCAHCSGEWGQPGNLAWTLELGQDQKDLVSIDLVGRYALSLEWKDGHHTGIYTWRLLRDLCPCEECRANAAAASE